MPNSAINSLSPSSSQSPSASGCLSPSETPKTGTWTSPKSEVRVTLSLEDAEMLMEMIVSEDEFAWDAFTKPARQTLERFDRAISKARRLPEPTDEEKQAMISQ